MPTDRPSQPGRRYGAVVLHACAAALLAGLFGCTPKEEINTDWWAQCLRENNNNPACCGEGWHISYDTCCPDGYHKALDVEYPAWDACIADEDIDAGADARVFADASIADAP